MSTRKILAILSLALGAGCCVGQVTAGGPGGNAEASADVTSGALTYYADCVNDAKDHWGVEHLDRRMLYRCRGDVAVSYFNYLGRQKTPDERETQPLGVFIFRTIRGKGRCWNMIADETGRPMSEYGCDILEQI